MQGNFDERNLLKPFLKDPEVRGNQYGAVRNKVPSRGTRGAAGSSDPVPVSRRSGESRMLEGTRRTLRVLEALGGLGDASLGEIARRAELPQSATHRLLRSFTLAGYANQDTASGRYHSGAALVQLFSEWLERFEIRQLARPALHDLAARTEETVHLVAYEAGRAFYADKVESSKTVRLASKIGAEVSLHSTAAGKAIIAFLSPEEARAAIRRAGLTRKTAYTLTALDELFRNLAEVVGRGFATDDRENEADVRCVGAPVFGRDGQPTAAVSVSAPAYRLSPERIEDIAPLVCRAAAEITRSYGQIDWASAVDKAGARRGEPEVRNGE